MVYLYVVFNVVLLWRKDQRLLEIGEKLAKEVTSFVITDNIHAKSHPSTVHPPYPIPVPKTSIVFFLWNRD